MFHVKHWGDFPGIAAVSAGFMTGFDRFRRPK
jgi:hypothetical protein